MNIRKYDEYITEDDTILRIMTHCNDCITIDTAKRRAILAEEQGVVPEGVGVHFSGLIDDLVREQKIIGDVFVDKWFSFQQLLQKHFDDLVINSFENNLKMGELPALNHKISLYDSIIDYVREMAFLGKDGKRYTVHDVTGCDILRDKVAYYNRLAGDMEPLPSEVDEYFDNTIRDREMEE